MKGFLREAMFLSLFLLLFVTGCGQVPLSVSEQTENEADSSGSQEEMTVRIAYNLPAEHATGLYFETLAEEIEKRTAETSIKMKTHTFPNAQLYNDHQLPDAVSTGGVEIGQLNVGFLAGGEAEPLRIIDLPFLFNSFEAQWEAEDGEYGKLYSEQLDKFNMKVIGWPMYGTVDLYANKPLMTPEDVQGLKMRGFGQGSSLILQELGASPISMSSQEIYQSMQHGTIDGYSTGPSSVISRGLYEVTKYGTDMNVNYLPFQAVVNTTWWYGLPDDVQSAILEASEVAEQVSRDQAKEDVEHYREELQKNGVELYTPTVEERKVWIEAVSGRYDDYLDKAGELGERLLDAVEKANQNNPSLDN